MCAYIEIPIHVQGFFHPMYHKHLVLPYMHANTIVISLNCPKTFYRTSLSVPQNKIIFEFPLSEKGQFKASSID